MHRPTDLLEVTEQIADLLAKQGIEAIVIGAAAMAAHHYVRHTGGMKSKADIVELRPGESCRRDR